MSREHPYHVVDVFTNSPFAGNAAAVVLDADGIDDDRMQSIAAEFNLSETTFVLPAEQAVTGQHRPDLRVRFRWFTPTVEVDMCGHATIAGIKALAESGRLSPPETDESTIVEIETRSGCLTAFYERVPGRDGEFMVWLDLVDPVLTPHRLDTAELAGALRLSVGALDSSHPPVATQDRDVIVFVDSVQSLNDARPDFVQLRSLLERERLRGLSLATTATLSSAIHVQSRFFAPTAGVNEDPVTGSVHGPLAVCVVDRGHVPLHDGLAGLTCVQGIPGGRTGLVHALVQRNPNGDHAVRIGGSALVTMSGTLRLGA